MAIEISQSLGSIAFDYSGFDKAEASVTKVPGAILTKIGNLVRTYETQSITDATTGADVKYNTKLSVDDIVVEMAVGKTSDVADIETAFTNKSNCTCLIKNKYMTIKLNCVISKIDEMGVDPSGTHMFNITLSISGTPTITRKFT
ncbi:hypothetical protein ACEUA8_01445 [Aeromonas veronii]